eukprot:1136521-Pelagomonas_calceolata.AAC.4
MDRERATVLDSAKDYRAAHCAHCCSNIARAYDHHRAKNIAGFPTFLVCQPEQNAAHATAPTAIEALSYIRVHNSQTEEQSTHAHTQLLLLLLLLLLLHQARSTLTKSKADASLASDRSRSGVPLRSRLTNNTGREAEASGSACGVGGTEGPSGEAAGERGSRRGLGVKRFCRRRTYLWVWAARVECKCVCVCLQGDKCASGVGGKEGKHEQD